MIAVVEKHDYEDEMRWDVYEGGGNIYLSVTYITVKYVTVNLV